MKGGACAEAMGVEDGEVKSLVSPIFAACGLMPVWAAAAVISPTPTLTTLPKTIGAGSAGAIIDLVGQGPSQNITVTFYRGVMPPDDRIYYETGPSSGPSGFSLDFLTMGPGNNLALLTWGDVLDATPETNYAWSSTIILNLWEETANPAEPKGNLIAGEGFYLGFRAAYSGEDYHYGFIRGFLAEDASSMTFDQVLYETAPGMAIVVPEPASLLLGSMGALALAFRRRGR
jgi:hypothetical protein